MSGAAASMQPLPQAPVADVPLGMTPAGAAHRAWRPNVFQWLAIWRLLVVAQGLAAAALLPGSDSLLPLLAGGLYALAVSAAAAWQPTWLRGRAVLVADLAVCVALLALATDETSFGLLALYSYSTIFAWAEARPIDAFIAAGVGAVACAVVGTLGPLAGAGVGSFVDNLALYAFFALATSGFFTVVRRIGALEIAAEIARERGRYRRDLHDRLGQALCGLHFELQAVHASGVAGGVHDRLVSLADGYRDARRMLRDLFQGSDEPLMATNIAAVIQQEAKRLAQQSGTDIDVTVEGEPARIPPWMRPHVWAVAAECMTNALKNGAAKTIAVELSVDDRMVVLSVTDDGSGFELPDGQVPDKDGHYGLREMHERARMCRGDLAIASEPGFGTRVRLQAPLPEGGADNIIERDASRLRENIWTLVNVLRVGLGSVALVQTALSGGDSLGAVATAALVALIAVDVYVPALAARRLYRLLGARPWLVAIPLVLYTPLFALSMATELPPFFLLYAPLVLLAAGIHGGRNGTTVMTVGFVSMMAVTLALLLVSGAITRADLPGSMLVYMTNTVLIGLSATQGARLLDRLETLQIRIRYQALARLRQGLSTRMRDQLAERLDELEQTTRALADDVPAAETFAVATRRLEEGSSDLKQRLRDIVHQLADPTPGRTDINV